MTQEQLADATGLTSVHVSRSLMGPAADGLIVCEKRFVGIPERERLRNLCGSSELYLHLDHVA
ncbi:helix-turn-helix domain-containing protein [Croceibacterium mercuriale]|uniref:helix-turn-helix domain-containing protein n=1 Tax=Croceibacterium mercuriale TaxID=1572751 RepID=UPI00068AB32B|nr:helix-turn-helix domain-containing protein [Croceibacterium mercuriale]